MSVVSIAIVDDHELVREGIKALLTKLGHQVCGSYEGGEALLEHIAVSRPDIVLMDLHMNGMDGWEAIAKLKSQHPEVFALALSMSDDEFSVMRAIRAGARGYLLKGSSPDELHFAITELMSKGYYYSDFVNHSMTRAITGQNRILTPDSTLSEKEIEFVKHACEELTYREIAVKMKVSPRTVDGYRDALYQKLGIKSRVGAVLYAIRHNLVKI